MNVTAIIPTKGGYDISEVTAPLDHMERVYVASDSVFLWNRYFGAWMRANANPSDVHVYYSVDDDAVVDPAPILAAYDPGVVTCNMPQARRWEYPDGIALMGWGSVFDTTCLEAFRRYLKHWPADELFYRECDRIFSGLNKVKLVDAPFRHLERATAPDRMGQEARHMPDLAEVRRRIAEVKRREQAKLP